MIRLLLLALPLLPACGSPDTTVMTELNATSACDVTATPCAAADDGVQVVLRLPPAPAPLKPFEAQVRIIGREIQNPVLALSMLGMDMGDNRYRLMRAGEGAWNATVVLPVCTLGRADWVADVTFSADGTRYRARFPFSTGK